jgi:hypothetical protein
VRLGWVSWDGQVGLVKMVGLGFWVGLGWACYVYYFKFACLT